MVSFSLKRTGVWFSNLSRGASLCLQGLERDIERSEIRVLVLGAVPDSLAAA